MATVERFEDLVVWKAARELASAVYRCSNQGSLAKDYPLRDQLRRAAISVMANIAEGFERGGDREFVQFLGFAKGSCGEVRSLLVIANDQGYITDADAGSIAKLCQKIARMIAGLMSYLDNSPRAGRRLGTASTRGTSNEK